MDILKREMTEEVCDRIPDKRIITLSLTDKTLGQNAVYVIVMNLEILTLNT